jgi:superfamily II DNA/RNA helicase
MKENNNTKWLIFNDNGNVLIRYQEFLLKQEIKAVMLDGGNEKVIEKSLKDYKEGDVQVLLLNSMIEGAGMNLENTTHLLFMHKTAEKFIEQVMGRAQRYGRTTPLNVIMLFNKHE